jgi:hypothetical protein
MADNEIRPDQGKAPGKGVKPGSTAGHDVRLQKRNKNVGSSLPDRAKTQKAEADMTERLRMARISKADPRGKGHGRRYGAGTFAVILDLRRQGMTFKQIADLKQIGEVRLPSERSLSLLQEQNVELKEAWRHAYTYAVREGAEETLGLARSLDKVRGLKGKNLVDARDKRIQRQLQIARQRLPDEWGGDQEGESEVIVFEASGGWVPTATIKGAPGQGAEGEAAAARWAAILKKRGRIQQGDSDA